ncbi:MULTISPECIES: MOSC domain-containing protein [Protofrankia]|uniref:Sulfurase n=1 Tax=Protofrankia coriariae TaxID=1562887 RepID=A0ABR5F2I5_9ACTN|nr:MULTISPECIES: MOSC domain-containing protein [Protofrankia]KLL10937.1 sulfurase [Protofrankia coriariae]
MPRIAHLYRYPIKGLSAEMLDSMTLSASEGLLVDRVYALARPETVFDEAHPQRLPKTRFLMLAKNSELARVASRYDAATGLLTLDHPVGKLTADLGNARDRAAVEDYFATLLADTLHGDRPRLVAGSDSHRFTDASIVSADMMRAISIINLASVRDIADRLGTDVHHLRFRANIYVDDVDAWSELDWVGHEIDLGGVRVKALVPTGRCAATTVNPRTGERDIRIPKELQAHYGHINCGVYAAVRSDGTIRIGDQVTVDDQAAPEQP